MCYLLMCLALVLKHWGGSTVVCELVVPVNMCIVRCNLVVILCRFDLRYTLLVSVNMLCLCLTINVVITGLIPFVY